MQDFLAGRISPSLFDCEIPPRARTELVAPRRRGRWRLDINGLIGLAVLAAVIVVGMYLGRERTPVPISAIAVPVSTPVSSRGESLPAAASVAPAPPAPVAAPTPGRLEPVAPAPEVRRAELIEQPPRRAELVKLPPPRAKLVGIPLGSWVRLAMPDGSKEYALFRGLVPSGAELPAAGAPGDLYIASDTGYAWVWVPSVNNGAGGWIDP
jgi:hypothetical protein